VQRDIQAGESMKSRPLKLAASIAGSCLLVVVAVLAVDGLIAVNRLNPAPEAQSAAAAAGHNVELLQVRTVNAEGGLFGSTAVVEYRLGDADDAEQLEVRLKRPLLSPRWMVVSVETK
jgi:hypothetical protein